MLNLEGLYLFVQVVEAGSFAAAARKLSIPTSTLSRKVMQLEQQLGIRLLHRSSRKLTLTESGQQYFTDCQPLLHGVEEATLALDEQLTNPSGTLRISAPISLANNLLAPWLTAFAQRYPKIQLQLKLTNQTVDVIEESIDVAFHVGEIHQSRWISRVLFESPFIVCASPTYLAERGIPTHPDELLEHDLVVLQLIQSWRFTSTVGEQRTIRKQGRMLVDELGMAARAAMAGIGIANLAWHVVERPLAQGSLVELLPGWTVEPRQIHLLYADRQHIPRKVRVFVDFIIEQVAAQRLESPALIT